MRARPWHLLTAIEPGRTLKGAALERGLNWLPDEDSNLEPTG